MPESVKNESQQLPKGELFSYRVAVYETPRNGTTVDINGFQAILFQATEDCFGVLYNDGQYIYEVAGKIPAAMVIEIAQNLK